MARNLKNRDLKEVRRAFGSFLEEFPMHPFRTSKTKRALSLVSALSALSALSLVSGCKSNVFTGRKAPKPVARDEGKLSPKEDDKGKKPGPLPTKQVVLEIQPAPLESSWNNCVTVTYNGQSFDAGCSKAGGPAGGLSSGPSSGLQVVTIPIAASDTCAVLVFEVKTFKNQGKTCHERVAAGQTCEGPYGDTPDWTRSSVDALGANHFKWERVSGKLDSTLRFEDQSDKNMAAAAADPVNADKTHGVDFDDVVLRIVPKDVTVVVQQSSAAAGAAGPTGQNSPAPGCK